MRHAVTSAHLRTEELDVVKSMAAVCWRSGEPWTIEEIDVDPPGPGELLVEWAAAGLCHSDEHFRSGDRVPAALEDQFFPLVGGHEGAGVVSQVGPGSSYAVGDHVVATFAPTCGRCRYCSAGRGFLCNANKNFMLRGQLVDDSVKHRVGEQALYVLGKLGTYAERTCVAEASVVRIDASMSMEAACLVSCGVATGWGAAVNRAETRPGDLVVVVGLGGLGIGAVQGARLAGAAQIVGIDPVSHRREVGQKLGVTHASESMERAQETIAHLSNGQGADRVILTPSVVTGEIIHDALALTGKGAVCVVVGMGPLGESAVPIDIGAFALFSKELRGCLFGSFDPRASADYLLGLYTKGLLDLDAMITTYPLADIGRGLADSLEGRNVRGVLTMQP